MSKLSKDELKAKLQADLAKNKEPKAKSKRLGIDPFANKPIGGLDMLIGSTTEPRDLNVKETPSKPKRGRPTEIKRDITKTSQSGLREGLTRATFIIREDTLDRLKDRAYT